MTPIVIIGCGAAKVDLTEGETVPIVDLYTGNLFRSRLAYARIYGGPHYVASGHHGLVRSDTHVHAYELDLRERANAEQRAWYREHVLHTLEREVDRKTPIIALLAGVYAQPFHTARERGWSVEIPAEGLPIGEALRFLKLALRGRPVDVEPTRSDAMTYAAQADAIRAELERDSPADDDEWTITTGALRVLLRRGDPLNDGQEHKLIDDQPRMVRA